MKQSALEFLESKMTDYIQRLYKSEIEQAKEMEKDQIIDAYNKVSMSTGEQYYNETFKNKYDERNSNRKINKRN